MVCCCKTGEKMGSGSCRHIQCANGDAFDDIIFFLDMWCYDRKIDFIDAMTTLEQEIDPNQKQTHFECVDHDV